MKRIYKYDLTMEQHQTIHLPFSHQILSVMEQNNRIVLYAYVNPDSEPNTPCEILIIGTGWPIDSDMEQYHFLGTVSMDHGSLMFHVFYQVKYHQ